MLTFVDLGLTTIILTKFLNLQILEPESCWEPVSSTDMIDSDAVRKSYKKAIYLIRPNKLTQRGASTREKYICGKVIEMLKVCM